MDSNTERLRRLCAERDRAVAAVQAEVDRQAGKTRTAYTGTTCTNSHTYTINYGSPVSQASPKRMPAITPAQKEAELQKIRQQFFREQELQATLSRVMEHWQDPVDYEPDLRANFGNR